MGKPDEKAKDPSSTSMAYDAMAPKWDMINTLLGGTASMREAGQLYLPPHSHETDKNYSERLSRNTLTNYFDLTLNALVGKPFSDPLEPNDDVPKEMVDLLKDIDFQGNNLHVFCRQWFKDGFSKGLSHVLVDFPSMDPEEREGRTLADDQKEKRRPYWNLIRPENLIFAYSEDVNGVDTLLHVRIREQEIERKGFTEEVIEKILVLEPGYWAEYVEKKVGSGKKTEWVIEHEGTTDIDVIPLITFYADHTGPMMAKPPLEDLAYLNIRHWQSTSDQISVVTVARFPMLAVAGAHDADGDVLAIGPKQLLGTRDPNGKFYYVEHSGKAIESGAKDLAKLEDDMAAYGAEFLRKRPGGQTATARALDSAEATSPLQDISLRFNDAVNRALDMMAKWLGIEDGKGGTVTVLTDYGPEKANDIDLRTLNETRRNRDLSRQNFLEELARRGVLADGFDYEENLKELEEEVPIASPFATGGVVPAGGQTADQRDDPTAPNPDNPEKPGEMKPEDMKPEDMKPEDMKPEDKKKVPPKKKKAPPPAKKATPKK